MREDLRKPDMASYGARATSRNGFRTLIRNQRPEDSRLVQARSPPVHTVRFAFKELPCRTVVDSVQVQARMRRPCWGIAAFCIAEAWGGGTVVDMSRFVPPRIHFQFAGMIVPLLPRPRGIPSDIIAADPYPRGLESAGIGRHSVPRSRNNNTDAFQEFTSL